MKYFPSFLPHDVFLFNVLFNVFDVRYNDVPLNTMTYCLT